MMPLHYNPALFATFLVILDLAGTFVFALSGAMSGVQHRLDLFGRDCSGKRVARARGRLAECLGGRVPRAMQVYVAGS
jgi:uncharacterized membrane protein YeiH